MDIWYFYRVLIVVTLVTHQSNDKFNHVILNCLVDFFHSNQIFRVKNVDDDDKDHENIRCEMDTDATAPIVHDIVALKRLRSHKPENTLEVGAKHVVPGLYHTFQFLTAITHPLTFILFLI